MKNTILILSLGIAGNSFGQAFTVTPLGLRNEKDTAKTFVMVETGDISAKQMYDHAIKSLTDNFSDPEVSIKESMDSVRLTFETFVPEFLIYNNSGAKLMIEATYTTELDFFDGRFRYEITALKMKGVDSKYKLLFQGGFLQAYIVYLKNGKLFKPHTKADIENYFNGELSRLKAVLKGN